MAGKYRKPSGVWYLSWYEGKRLVRRSLGRVTEAEAEAQRVAKTLALGTAPAAGPLFSSWAQTYAIWHSTEYPDSYFRVEQILRGHLIPYFGSTPLLGLKREQVEAYKQVRLQAVSPTTVTKELRTLQAALNAAVDWGEIPHNPVKGVKAPRDPTSRPPRWYTRDELQKIYTTEENAPKETTQEDRELHRRYRWAWQLLANTGMRRGEALHLRWQNVDEAGGSLQVVSTEGARTKSGRWRLIPLTAGARAALEQLKVGEEHVLPQISPSSMTRAFHRTLGRAGLDGGLHCLRHTYCSHLVQQGVPLRTVQVLAGHSSVRVTEVYAHLAPGHLQDAVARLDL